MSSKKTKLNPSGLTQEEVNEGFEQALENGTLTDIMGNPISKEDLEIVPWNIGEERDLSFSEVIMVVKGLQGKVLTVVDATYTDNTRLKYVKDLIKDAFSQQSDWLFELAHKQQIEENTK